MGSCVLDRPPRISLGPLPVGSLRPARVMAGCGVPGLGLGVPLHPLPPSSPLPVLLSDGRKLPQTREGSQNRRLWPLGEYHTQLGGFSEATSRPTEKQPEFLFYTEVNKGKHTKRVITKDVLGSLVNIAKVAPSQKHTTMCSK